jgi:hypothetical protein
MPEKKLQLKGFKHRLPTKICKTCEKPFQYRKKWAKVWHEIQYCSEKCKRLKLHKKGPETSSG